MLLRQKRDSKLYQSKRLGKSQKQEIETQYKYGQCNKKKISYYKTYENNKEKCRRRHANNKMPNQSQYQKQIEMCNDDARCDEVLD